MITTEFDRKAGGRLREILVKYDSDLVAPPRRVKVDTLSKNFTKLRIERGATEAEIKAMLRWLYSNYDHTYCPDMHKALDLAENWRQYKRAKKRCEDDLGRSDDADPDPDDDAEFRAKTSLITKARDWLHANVRGWSIDGRTLQADLDRALEALGREPGELSAMEV